MRTDENNRRDYAEKMLKAHHKKTGKKLPVNSKMAEKLEFWEIDPRLWIEDNDFDPNEATR